MTKETSCNLESLFNHTLALPRQLLRVALGTVGMTPTWVKESLPTQLNDLLTESENLFNRCAERGEIMLEQWRN